MRKTLLSFLLILFFFSSKAQLPASYAARLDFVFDSICAKRNIKGASAAVYVPNMDTWKRAYGISKPGEPITTDMVLGIGSNTKTIIATLLLIMQEEALIDLDAQVGAWVNHPNIDGQITIRQLLNHTSGIYSYTSNPALNDSLISDFNRVWEPEEMLQFVNPPTFAPGTNWGYSNTNYLLAGIIIRDVLGQPLSQSIRNKIFSPLAMGNTFLWPEEQATAIIPNVWSKNFTFDGKLYDVVTDFNYSSTAIFSMAWAAGAIMGTASDNALFWHKLATGEILSPASMAEMGQWVPLSSSISYGLGVFQLKNFNGRNVYSHGGTNIGFINENIGDPVSGVGISVLTNQDSVNNSTLLNALVFALHKITINPPVDDTYVNHFGTMDKIQLYPNPSRGTINLTDGIGGILNIYDLTGREVFSEKVYQLENISLHKLPNGFYITRLIGSNGETLLQKKILISQ